eukprot:TRINITY_DN102460_c0_g1_i1.p1 TRINITY_DN102460_c0_g1~~TRINITY_DN102460_c0_g1_i1.p1  ORF type:complete len:478 (-),score=37.29 TRINITY_DN102460_c0_g1_i1:133-1566(-)
MSALRLARRGQSLPALHRPAMHRRSVDAECCICLGGCEECTPCGHSVCRECWEKLPQALCPMCRRPLPSSPSSVAKWLVKQEGYVALDVDAASPRSPASPGTSRSWGRRSNRSFSVSTNLEDHLSKLPNRFAKKMRRLQRRQTLAEVLECAEMLADIRCTARSSRSSQVSPEYDWNDLSAVENTAASFACQVLSDMLVVELEKVKLKELIVMSSPLLELMRRQALQREVLCRVVDDAVVRALNACYLSDGRSLFGSALPALVETSIAMSVIELTSPAATKVALRISTWLPNLILGLPLHQLPMYLHQAFEVVGWWPVLANTVHNRLKADLPPRLARLAASPNRGVSSTQMSRVSFATASLSTPASSTTRSVLWLDVLRTAMYHCLLDSTQLQGLCAALSCQFQEDGTQARHLDCIVQSATAHSLSALVPCNALHVAKLGRMLASNPLGTRFLQPSNTVVYGCPSEGGSLTPLLLPDA